MKRAHRLKNVAMALAIAAGVAGCGVKGVPLPPEAVAPQRITDLGAAPDKDGIRLSWARPENYVGGRRMRDLAGFVILRSAGDAPFKPVIDLPVPDRERFQKERRFDYVDTTAVSGQRYRYQIISTTEDGYRSKPSNMVEFTRIAPPPASSGNFALPQPTPLP